MAEGGHREFPPELRLFVADNFGADVDSVLFVAEHLSSVWGLRLADGSEVVVKARPGVDRARVCVAGQTALHDDGFACPRPLTEVVKVAGLAVHAEEHLAGETAPATIGAEVTDHMASLLAELVTRSRRLQLPQPRPGPMWLAWDHSGPTVWPEEPGGPGSAGFESPPGWLTELAARVRARLRRVRLEEVVAHGDWEVQNMGWDGPRVRVVYDWDSLTTRPEAALVGAAAATFPSGAVQPLLASLTASERFLEVYMDAAGRRLSAEEVQVAWASGLWLAAHNARMELRHGQPPLVLTALMSEGAERLSRAGA